MSGGLYKKAFLITNATDALGLAISRRLGLAGAKVFLTDRNQEKLQKVVFDLKELGVVATGAVVDPSQAGQRQQLFAEVFSQFLTTPFQTVVSSLPLLQKANIAGYSPFIDIGLYSTVQTSLLGLTKALAKDLAKKNVRVNSVVLGMFSDDNSGGCWNEEENKSHLQPLIPLGRIARACDCAGLVEFLVSDRARYITGENCPLTGGINVRL